MNLQRIQRFISTELVPYIRSKKKPLAQQIKEVNALWHHYNYPPYHYWKHRLYQITHTNELHADELLEYVPPIIIERFQQASNPKADLRIIWDKLETNARVSAKGLPCIETLLHVDGAGTIKKKGSVISVDDALAFLANINGEVFIKPVDSGAGKNARPILASDIGGDFLSATRNTMIQPLIRNHSILQEMSPLSLNTVRIDVINVESEAVINAACLKVGTGVSRLDNWAQGSIAIGVDLSTGKLAPRGIQKAKFGRAVLQFHPDTGTEFSGVTIPFWQEVLDLARKSGAALQPHTSLGIDIAITPQGPLFVEANETGDVFMLQEASGPLGKTRLAQEALRYWHNGQLAN